MAKAEIDAYNAPESWTSQRDDLTQFTLTQLRHLVEITQDDKIKLEALKTLSATLALGKDAKSTIPSSAVQQNTFNLSGKELPKSLADRLGIQQALAVEPGDTTDSIAELAVSEDD